MIRDRTLERSLEAAIPARIDEASPNNFSI